MDSYLYKQVIGWIFAGKGGDEDEFVSPTTL